MKVRLILFIVGIGLTAGLSASAQKKKKDTDRGYAFEGRSFVVSLGSGFFGYSYGYGKSGGAPLILTLEYGLHRYVGVGIYGGLLDRNPKIGETTYDMTVYTVGARADFHLYNLIDDIVEKDLRGDIIDVYGIAYIGMEQFESNIQLPNKRGWYISGGIGVRAYPFKKARRLGVFSEFSTVLTPWLMGLNYRF